MSSTVSKNCNADVLICISPCETSSGLEELTECLDVIDESLLLYKVEA